MKVGFTGTQTGTTFLQGKTIMGIICYLIDYHSLSEFHHGDCVGADTEIHCMVDGLNAAFPHSLNLPKVHLIGHPPDSHKKRGNNKFYATRPAAPYLKRNHNIVDETDLLIACPKGHKEELRSGTWATIRYALKKKKPVIIILPSGETSIHNLDPKFTAYFAGL
jgi:hypothetical protein